MLRPKDTFIVPSAHFLNCILAFFFENKSPFADKLRNNMDAAEYKHVVLGLIFLKYIADAFDDHKMIGTINYKIEDCFVVKDFKD